MVSCSAVRSVSLEVKEVVLDHVLTILLVLLIGICTLDWYTRKKLKLHPFYKHHSQQTIDGLANRGVQTVVGPIAGLSGIVFLLYAAISKCHASEIYLYIIGTTIVACDVQDMIRTWPLKLRLLVHHLTELALILGIAEFDLPLQGTYTVAFVCIVGINWTCDALFHASYRLSCNIKLISICRYIFLGLSIFRGGVTILLFVSAVFAALDNEVAKCVLVALTTFGYGINAYEVIVFVARFDCEQYYATHQAVWLRDGNNKNKVDEVTDELSREYDGL